MESEKCRHQALCGFVAAIFVSFVVFVFIFGNAHWEALNRHPAYLIVKDNGSLIAGLIALFAALYTVAEHKKQSRKEFAERDRREALASLIEIRSQIKFFSSEMMGCPTDTHHLKMLEDNVFQLLKHSIVIDNYLIHSHDEVSKLKSALIFEQCTLLQKYLLHSRVLRQNRQMLEQKSIKWRADELNDDYLSKIKSTVERINTLSNGDKSIELYDHNFVFKRNMRNDCDIGAALSSLNESVIAELIIKVRLINEVR